MPLKSLWSLLLFGLLLTTAFGQEAFNLSAESLANGQAVELDKLGWKYSPGDDPRFADPQFDDRAWETLNGTAITLDSIPKSGWRGLGWFRLRLQVDPALANQPLNLEMFQLGASEVYLDGRIVERYGKVGQSPNQEEQYNPNARPLSVTFNEQREHVLAIRYSNQKAADISSGWGRWLTGKNAFFILDFVGIGFVARLKKFGDTAGGGYMNFFTVPYVLIQTAVYLSFALLHLLLFAFYPRQRAGLIYSLFLFASFISTLYIVAFQVGHFSVLGFYLLMTQLHGIFALTNFLLLLFVHTAFHERIPRFLWLFAVGNIIWLALFATSPGHSDFYALLQLAMTFEAVRVTVQAILKRQQNAWVLGIGIFFYCLLLIREVLNSAGLLSPFWYVGFDAISTYGLILTFTIYIAREFAHTNKNLEHQLVQVKQLSAAALEHEKVKAENDRRAAELEEARQLQLSMLPKKLPSLPHLDIAAYMKTASEVGGDYYDFHTSEDGTLTIAVGDATGHGLKAGTLVSSVKSLFVSLAYHSDIPHIFQRMNSVLKEMNLRGLFMAMTMVKVKGNQMSVSIAGMPSVLIYRAQTGVVEEVVMRALPLGGMTKYQYQQQELTIAENDVVVLMSDGLPERFNPNGEMLEEQAAKQYLAQHAQASAQELIEGLAKLGDDWGGARPQDDDVTFVVLKYVECGRLAAAFSS